MVIWIGVTSGVIWCGNGSYNGDWKTNRNIELKGKSKIHEANKQVEGKVENVKMKEKPTSQAAGLVLHEMSIVVKNQNLDEKMNEAIIGCLSNATWTIEKNWGLYNTSKFAESLIQAEYYAFVKTERALQFRVNITKYMKEKKLGKCAQSRYDGMKTSAEIIYARKIIESLPNGTRSEGGIKAWIIGIVVGVVVLLGVIMGVIAMFRKTRIFDELVYEQMRNEEDAEAGEAAERRQLAHLTAGYN